MLRRGWAPLALLAALAALGHAGVRAAYLLPDPHYESLVLGESGLQDLIFTASGFRRIAADVAWIQFLQSLSGDEHESSPEAVRAAALRVARLDAHFIPPYMFGAGVLAFDPHDPRPFEAISLLQEGIERNPKEWRLQSIMAAILYKAHDKPGPMIAELEKLSAAPDCPGLMRAILANIYKKQGRLGKALAVWRLIVDSGASEGEKERAQREIAEISAAIQQGSSRNLR